MALQRVRVRPAQCLEFLSTAWPARSSESLSDLQSIYCGANAVRLVGDGQYGFQVVGESHHQAAIERIVGGTSRDGAHYQCIAAVRAEPTNLYDRNAVEVLIDDIQVGYIPAYQAPDMCRLFRAFSVSEAQCEAIIQGGWDRGHGDTGFLGVRLNIVRPFAFNQAEAPDIPDGYNDRAIGAHRMEIALALLVAAIVGCYLLYNTAFSRSPVKAWPWPRGHSITARLDRRRATLPFMTNKTIDL